MPMNVSSDVQSEKSLNYDSLDWVGMSQIQTSVVLKTGSAETVTIAAVLDVGVDLMANHRGIHMSRLYQLHHEHILNKEISKLHFSNYSRECLSSHAVLSQNFSSKLKLNWPKKTLSLMSNLPGFRNYPVEIIFEKSAAHENLWLQFEILYSSTCPQSAGLALEVLNATQSTPLERLPATPHAQRSRAVVQVQVSDLNQEIVESFFTEVELALGTPVQTTVKRVDELRFAELNAENLMFCEDAARKVSQALKNNTSCIGFSIRCEHLESLHPHNATSLKKHQYKGPNQLSFC